MTGNGVCFSRQLRQRTFIEPYCSLALIHHPLYELMVTAPSFHFQYSTVQRESIGRERITGMEHFIAQQEAIGVQSTLATTAQPRSHEQNR